jgi:outer membrane receptor for ferrienterochelin and colicins
LNAKITINEKQDLRLSYGRGFRAPALRELYFNFVDASHNIQGNPNLKAEMSNSVNGSWNWQVFEKEGNKVTTAVGVFFNDINNQITIASLNNSASYINIDRYKTKGITWNNSFRNRNWDLSLGASYTGRFNQLHEDATTPEFTWAPEITSNISYRTIKGGWTFSAYYKYTGRLPFAEPVMANGETTIHIAKLNAYQWSDVSVQKQVLKDLTVTGGVRNLFNIKTIGSTSLTAAGAHGGGNSRPIGSGRGFFVDLTYTISQ